MIVKQFVLLFKPILIIPNEHIQNPWKDESEISLTGYINKLSTWKSECPIEYI